MALDPQVAQLLKSFESMDIPPVHEMPVEQARELTGALAGMMGDPEPVPFVEDRTVPGPDGPIPVRLYSLGAGPSLPVLVYFHGGGWVTGDLALVDSLCRALVNRAACAVLSVDYRLAPEHPWPAGLEDCFAAVRWVAEHAGELGLNSARLAVGGDSAGGNLAAAVCLKARDRGGPPIAFQALLCPILDCSFDTASYRENGEGYFLTAATMHWFWDQYLAGRADGSDPAASPLRASDLTGLPPALIITAEFDPLRDEGEAYGARLEAAGVPVTVRRWEGQIHAFLTMGLLVDDSQEGIDAVATALRRALET